MNTKRQSREHPTTKRVARCGCAMILAVLWVAMRAQPLAAEADTGPGCSRCILCSPQLTVPVVHLTTEWLDSMAHRYASYNEEQLEHIDSLLQAGYYGPPADESSRRAAHLAARLNTINAYRDLVLLACDSTHVYEADEATLRELYRRYSDVNLFIDARLTSVRMGMGRVCMRYRLDENAEGLADHGGKQLRWRVKDVKIDGSKRRLLAVDFPTGADNKVEILLAAHHTFAVEYRKFDNRRAPYEWFLVRDIEGAWLHKWGTHRPTAYMFWVSTPSVAREAPAVMNYTAGWPSTPGTSESAYALPSIPLVGLRIYIPDLKLRLPLLPDINVDDLREIELPMPILDLEYLRQGRQPSWLTVDANLGFEKWVQHGSIPAEIRRAFPDR